MIFTAIPRLYAILDGAVVRKAGLDVLETARSLRDAGLTLIQYRDKDVPEPMILKNARAIRSIFDGRTATLVLNDWPKIALAADWDGVHVGQTDVSVAEARRLLGPGRLVGLSTHSPGQFARALETDANYIAYGPIFDTTTKRDAEPSVGLEQLRQVRGFSSRPLVAIGGITCERIGSVLDAGADCVALVGALFQPDSTVLSTATMLLRTAEQLPAL